MVWAELNPQGVAPTPRVSVSSVLALNKLYFFGGYDGISWKNDIFIYNICINFILFLS